MSEVEVRAIRLDDPQVAARVGLRQLAAPRALVLERRAGKPRQHGKAAIVLGVCASDLKVLAGKGLALVLACRQFEGSQQARAAQIHLKGERGGGVFEGRRGIRHMGFRAIELAVL